MPYTTQILKAGALIPDTLELLLNWDEGSSINANLKLLKQGNSLGKTTRERVKVILRILSRRYLLEEHVARSLAKLAKSRFPASYLTPILYFFSVCADDLLRDTVLDFLSQRRASGIVHIDTEDLKRELQNWITQGKIKDEWSGSTLIKVARSLLATLRDFGVLHGAANKTLAPIHLPIEAFAYIAYYLKTKTSSGDLLLKNHLWGIYFLTPGDVERLLVQADQMHLSVVRAFRTHRAKNE